MPWLHGLILGLVQGLTEFFPVSSSGHLILVPRLFGWVDQGLAFDTVLHLGTLGALLWFFYKDILSLLRRALDRRPEVFQPARRFMAQVIVATLPALVLGFLTKDLIETALRGWQLVAFNLALWSFVLLFADRYSQRRIVGKAEQLEQITWKQALIVGCAQPLALLPGTSRSGMTITAGLFSGLNRETAARFSFFLSIPVTAAAGGYGVLKMARQGLGAGESWSMLIVGFLAAFVAGAWAIRFLLSYVAKKPYTIFVGYRLALAVVVLFIH